MNSEPTIEELHKLRHNLLNKMYIVGLSKREHIELRGINRLIDDLEAEFYQNVKEYVNKHLNGEDDPEPLTLSQWSNARIFEHFNTEGKAVRNMDALGVDSMTGFGMRTVQLCRDDYEARIVEYKKLADEYARITAEAIAENKQLRAKIPSAEIREMIKWYVDGDLSGEIAPKFPYHRCYAALEWLDSLEETGE